MVHAVDFRAIVPSRVPRRKIQKSRFMVQGGDIINGNGTGGDSIYGGPFNDENHILPHKKWVLAMANNGVNTNLSGFYIYSEQANWNDGKNVDFYFF